MKALIALEDGRIFPAKSFTGPGEAEGEVVFNTSMSGYQEILTDPSYSGQMVTMTYPLIGNYGTNEEDVESEKVQVAAFLVREYQHFPSNYRSRKTLADYLVQNRVMGVESLDTRALTRHIRKQGAMRAVISTKDLDPGSLVRRAGNIPKMKGQDLTPGVTTRTPYFWTEKGVENIDIPPADLKKTVWQHNRPRKIVTYDFGIKYNILRSLRIRGCEILVLPSDTPAKIVEGLEPDGIFLSNGPGDPEPVSSGIESVKALLDYRPMFGICLGHQILGLALGGKTYKLKFGHRGANQPVLNKKTGKIEITSQNHGFAVDARSLSDKPIDITHINLNDNTLEGFRHRKLPLLAVQYHPEASPGPHDAQYLFDEFISLLNQ